jgi:polyhydroxybutyrate depolymerase
MTVRTTFLHRALVALCAFVLSCGLLSGQGLSRRCEHRTVRFQKMDREYYLYIPASMKPGAALVIALHGHGGQAEDMPAALLTTADKGGFALCVPQGIIGPEGHPGWNVGYPFQKGMKSDDVAFICFLAKKLQKEFGLSRSDAFLTGMSNGGEMCYLTAWSADTTFTALASVAGLMMKWRYDGPAPTRAIPFLEIHGTADKTSHWEGDPEGKFGWGGYTSVPPAVAGIVSLDRCPAYERTVLEPRNPGAHRIILHRYSGGQAAWEGGPSCEVRLYEVEGGKHSWFMKDIDTCREIWDFFKQYLR